MIFKHGKGGGQKTDQHNLFFTTCIENLHKV